MDNKSCEMQERKDVKADVEDGKDPSGTNVVKSDVKPKSSRRPDIDVIRWPLELLRVIWRVMTVLFRIVLTWGILAYHVTLIYTPYLSYYVRVIPDQAREYFVLWSPIFFWTYLFL